MQLIMKGQFSDAMYVLAINLLENNLYMGKLITIGETEPSTPTGLGNTDGWHRALTVNARWVSKKQSCLTE